MVGVKLGTSCLEPTMTQTADADICMYVCMYIYIYIYIYIYMSLSLNEISVCSLFYNLVIGGVMHLEYIAFNSRRCSITDETILEEFDWA